MKNENWDENQAEYLEFLKNKQEADEYNDSLCIQE